MAAKKTAIKLGKTLGWGHLALGECILKITVKSEPLLRDTK